MTRLEAPPIRTPLTSGAKGASVKDWYYYWQQSGSQINAHTDALAQLSTLLDQTIESGTHANRLAPAGLPLDALYVETDRGNAIYQVQSFAGVATWVYVAGVMPGTMSPDQRPADLGAYDAGFQFRATDTLQTFYWNGSAWVETTAPQNTLQSATATSSLTLSGSPQTVPGTSITLARAGTYHVHAVFFFAAQGAGDVGWPLVGCLNVNGTNQGQVATLVPASATQQVTAAQQWAISVTAGASIALQAYKSGGTGSSSVNSGHTTVGALWVSS